MNWQEAKPKPKVAAGTLAGALTVMAVWIASLFGAEIPGFVAAAMVTILGFIVAWFVPESSDG